MRRQTDAARQSVDEGVAARPLEREHVLERRPQFLTESFAQPRTCAVEPGAHRFRLYVEDAGYFVDADTLDVAHDQNGAECRWQVVDGAFQQVADLAAGRFPFGCRACQPGQISVASGALLCAIEFSQLDQQAPAAE